MHVLSYTILYCNAATLDSALEAGVCSGNIRYECQQWIKSISPVGTLRLKPNYALFIDLVNTEDVRIMLIST